MALHDFIVKVLVNNTKGQVDFENQVNNLKSKLSSLNLSEEALELLISQKNKISSILSKSKNSLLSLSKFSSSTSQLLSILENSVKVITKLPIPTSTPPGVGVPFSALTTLSDSLDKLYDLIKENKGLTQSISSIIPIIVSSINEMVTKLDELDDALIEKIDIIVNEKYDLYLDQEIKLILPPSSTYQEKEDLKKDLKKEQKYINKKNEIRENFISQILKTQNITNNNILNFLNSNPSINYKGFKLEVQYDPSNKFNFPSRRIQGKKENIILYNDKGKYSFSSSLDVLFEEIKFQIDLL